MQEAGQRGRRDYGCEVVAREHHRDDAVAPFEQAAENEGLAVAALALGVDLETVGGHQRNFAGREKSLKDHAKRDRQEHRAGSHRLSLSNSTVAPRTRSTAASKSPSRNFSPRRGTRLSRRSTSPLSVCGPLAASE